MNLARWPRRNILACFLLLTLTSGCALFATRPLQEMSDTVAALRAAKQVQADILAPELYRQARERFYKARRAYKLKYFSEAKEQAIRARRYAERAEFEALKNGGNRSDVPDDPLDNNSESEEEGYGA